MLRRGRDKSGVSPGLSDSGRQASYPTTAVTVEPSSDDELDTSGVTAGVDTHHLCVCSGCTRGFLFPVTAEHLLTHKPALPKECDDCMRGKLKQPRKFVGAFQRELKSWGDIVTFDHLSAPEDNELAMGVGGETNALVIKDLYSGLGGVYFFRLEGNRRGEASVTPVYWP